jgi:hypothetical protein
MAEKRKQTQGVLLKYFVKKQKPDSNICNKVNNINIADTDSVSVMFNLV